MLEIKKIYGFKIVLYFIMIFLIAIFIRVFIFEIYTVPSVSMENALVPGDKIIVNKLIYGPKIPNSLDEVPWLNIFTLFNKDKKQKTEKYSYKRLLGFGSIKRKDVIVFYCPENKDVYVKRCIGVPGDNIKLINENLFVNNKQIKPLASVKNKYMLYSTKQNVLLEYLNKKEIPVIRKVSENSLITLLTNKTKTEIYKHNLVDSLRFVNKEFQKTIIDKFYNNTILPQTDASDLFISGDTFKTGWTIFNFGELYIPRKGDKIFLTDKNLSLYSKIIQEYEKHKLEFIDSSVFINGNKTEYYKFQQNYYFMLGDNRAQSLDSRYWGFVPESHIIAKAVKVLFSNIKTDSRKNRFLKDI